MAIERFSITPRRLGPSAGNLALMSAPPIDKRSQALLERYGRLEADLLSRPIWTTDPVLDECEAGGLKSNRSIHTCHPNQELGDFEN
jgi:hypothetical protein